MKRIISRRNVLKLGLLGAALPLQAFAGQKPSTGERRLSFNNLHTGETLDLPYWIEGSYVPESLAEINHLLRDHRNNQVAAIDPRLLDLLFRARAVLDTSQSLHIISGYRSPASNQLMASHSAGVAKRSLHMEGKAIDIRIPGIQLADLRRTGLQLQAGGVGYYPASNFVHLDVGRVRTWGAA